MSACFTWLHTIRHVTSSNAGLSKHTKYTNIYMCACCYGHILRHISTGLMW